MESSASISTRSRTVSAFSRDPAAVWADPAFFHTLPPRELRSGFAEIVKHALIADREQWHGLLNQPNLHQFQWSRWVADSVRIKQQIVEQDPFEKGLRKALNFGHTIGHAVESYFLESSSPLLHGEAIAIGMITEAWLSNQQSTLSDDDLRQITAFLLHHYGHQQVPSDSFDHLLALMQQDKKNEDARINFSLLPAPGQVLVNQTAEPKAITGALAYYNELVG